MMRVNFLLDGPIHWKPNEKGHILAATNQSFLPPQQLFSGQLIRYNEREKLEQPDERHERTKLIVPGCRLHANDEFVNWNAALAVSQKHLSNYD